MSDYTKSTNFATKDNLTPGDPLKIVRGTEIDTEFNNIAIAIATKTDNASAAITGGSITGITDLAIADGGTGASTANAALNNLLPSQASASGKYLKSNGTDSSWDALDISTADITGTLPVANGGTGVTSSTGTGSVVLSNSPTLVTPALGTPASGVATNLTGLPLSTGVTGTLPIANGGTGQTTANAAFNALAPSQATASGKYLKSDGTNTSWDDLDISTADITGTLPVANGGTGVTTSTGTGSVVLSNSPTLVTPALGTPSSATLTNATGLPISTGVSGLGTGVATALAVNVGSAGAPVVNGGALGTPSSGTVTNLTGTASININGTVGATTPTTGAFTTLSASSSVTLSGGTANGVTYLNGSKVLTSGSALTFDGSRLGVGVASPGFPLDVASISGETLRLRGTTTTGVSQVLFTSDTAGANYAYLSSASGYLAFGMGASSEQMRLTSTGLGIGTSSPGYKLDVAGIIRTSGTGYSSAGSPTLFLTNTTATTGRTYGVNSSNSGLLQITDETAGGASRVILDASGNLGIGTAPSAWGFGKAIQAGTYANLWDATAGSIYLTNNAYFDGGDWRRQNADYASLYAQISGAHSWRIAGTSTAGSTISFTNAMTLDASGNLGVGTTSPSTRIHAVATGGAIRMQDNAGTAKYVQMRSDSTNSHLEHIGGPGDALRINNQAAGTIEFFTSNTERARIDSSGNLLVGTTATSTAAKGAQLRADGLVAAVRDSNAPLVINRLTNDGTLVSLQQDTTEEGTISVSGTTVSYNGGHLSRYAQTTTAKDNSLVKGTVLSNLDEMNVYTKDGQPVANEQLNKVKVSDTEGDVNVAGVFVNWSHDEDHNVDEINMAMTGDMIIRIAQGVTVVRGDLLMSAGDGTAKPQGDDIIRSKTVAKVTSNHVTCTYTDGSYCVPCVLMAC